MSKRLIFRDPNGPGEFCQEGQRHDNGELYFYRELTEDHADIARIQIAPTPDELACSRDPYLPMNFAGSAHHLPADSMAKMYVLERVQCSMLTMQT